MKILFICENYLPHFGGAEVVFKNLAERYVKEGHDVSLLTHQLKGTKLEENINGVKVYRVPSFFSRYVFTFLAIPKALKLAKEADIIQTTSFNGAPPAWLAGKITKKPVTITVHEVWNGKWQEVTGFSWTKSKLHEILERCIYFLPFDKYTCVSNATRKDLLKLNIKKEKVKTIYNGLDYQFWDPNNFKDEEVQKIREKLNLKNKFVYFFWGRPGISKGFEYAIKAIKLIKKEVPNSKFVMMFGSAEKHKKKYQELMKLIEDLNLKEEIVVVKSAPYQKLGNYIKAADCVIVPSIAEGFGYTTTETVAMGTPVVVSDAGSLPEIVSGKYQIFKSKNVEDLADKVVKVARGEFLETEVKRFEWDSSVKQYLEVYQELIEK